MTKENFHRQITLSCRGPITRNYNALELAEYFIPNGGIFFSRLQRYDLFLSEAENRSTFPKAGRSFVYLLPFLKAFGATKRRIEEYSTVHVSLMPGVKTFFDHIRDKIPCFLISAAYEPFILSLCSLMGFQEANTYSTLLKLDHYSLNESEKETLIDLADEITKMPPVSWGEKNDCFFKEADPEHITYGQRLLAIFQEEIPGMQIGKILDETVVRAGDEKITAIKSSLEKTGNSPKEVMFIGSSILDVAALDWIKNNGGLAVSFNGDQGALRIADIAIISGNSIILAILGDVFFQRGKDGLLELIENWDLEKIHTRKFEAYRPLINQLFSQEMGPFPRLELVTDTNREKIISESEIMRQVIFQNQR